MRGRCALLSALALASLTTSACTTYWEQLRQFDSVARIDEGRPVPVGQALEYDRRPDQYRWVIRQLNGLGEAWARLVGIDPAPTEVSNPSGYARQRLARIVRMSIGDLRRTALAVARVHLVATSDRNRLNRIEALRAAGRILESLDSNPLMHLQSLFNTKIKAEQLWALEAGWPGNAGKRDEGTRLQYMTAVADLAVAPADDPGMQRQIVRLLANAERFERDPEVREITRAALRETMVFAMSAVLLRAAIGSLQTSGLEQETAIRELRRIGGPQSVPQLLALTASSRDPETGRPRRSEYISRYDTDVRRLLINECARLAGPVVVASANLGAGLEGPAPVQLLYDVYVNDRDQSLRSCALEGLARALGRPPEPIEPWAREWYDEWTIRSLERSSGGDEETQ